MDDAPHDYVSECELYRTQMVTDLALAEQVQRSMIPRSERRGDLEVVCRFTPMIGIGGDYASVYFQSETRVCASICDVTGHGIAAALLASRVNSFVLGKASSVRHPCEVGESLNEFICDTFADAGLFLTFFCLFLDLEARSLVYAGFGHPPVLFYSKQTKTVRRLDSENTMMGIRRDMFRRCSMLTLPFEPGDRLLLYTDGVFEARDARGRSLEIEGLEGYFRETAHLPPGENMAAMVDRVEAFRGGVPPADDQLLLTLSFVEGSTGGGGELRKSL